MSFHEIGLGSADYEPSPSSLLAVIAGTRLMLWNAAQAQRVEAFERKQRLDGQMTVNTDSVSWNHNGQVLAVCHRQVGTVALVEARSGKTLEAISIAQPECATFGANSRLLCVLENGRRLVSVWDLKKRKPVQRIEIDSSGDDELPFLSCIDPSDAFVCTLSPKNVVFYNMHVGERVALFRCPDTSTSCSGSPSAPGVGSHSSLCYWTCWDMLKGSDGGAVVALGTSVGGLVIVSFAGLAASATMSSASRFGQPPISDSALKIQQVIDHSLSSSSPLLDVKLLAPEHSATGSTSIVCAVSASALAVYDEQQPNRGLSRAFYTPLGREDPVTSLAWNADLIAVGFASGAVAVLNWRRHDHAPIQRFAATSTSLPIRQLSFGPSPSKESFWPHAQNVSIATASNFDQRVTPSPASAASFSALSSGMQSHLRHSSSSLLYEGLDSSRPESVKHAPLGHDTSLETLLRPVTQHDLQQLRHDFRASLGGLKVEMMRQLQVQSDEMNRLLSLQSQLLTQVLLENRTLREEILQQQRGEPSQQQDERFGQAAANSERTHGI